ncbi:MAG: GNAT family N-acetyltransferase [Flavobacteriaceae bacterium]
MQVVLEPLSKITIDTYIFLGTKSYNEHYPHLWENGDTSPYINKSFTNKVVEKELEDTNIQHFLVIVKATAIGIVKLIKNCPIDEFSGKESLLAEKIYLIKAYTGRGLGKKVLALIEVQARKLNKRILWLDTMQKGNPVHFYLNNGFQIKKEGELSLKGAKTSEKAMWVLAKEL